MSELASRSVEDLAQSVRGGELSALEVVEDCLERTASVEPRIGAYLEIFDEQARQAAAAVDARRQAGAELGVLAGVPIALKDNLNIKDRECTCGSRILRGYTATYHSTAVERILDADAVIIGRTNLDEFAMGSSCENSGFQLTRNPWALDRVPGGSSGGSAAAVAACSVPLALGSDTGGSIRQPAAFCGVVGLKPSYGRVSRYGLVAFASSLDQIGPLAGNVRDTALALAVIAGADPLDATCSTAPVDDYLAGIEDGVDGLRIGVVRQIDTGSLSAAVLADWRRSLERLEQGGAELVEVSIPNVPASIAVYYVLANCEASANLARYDGIRYGHRAGGGGALIELYEQSRQQGFGPEVKRRILLGTFALSSGYYDEYYGRANGVRQALRRQLEEAFDEVDLIVSPTCPTAAFGIGEKVDDPLEMYLQDIYTTPASLAGLPAIALPSGFDDEGMPLSLQVIARPFEESLLLRAARAFEATTGEDFRAPVNNGTEA